MLRAFPKLKQAKLQSIPKCQKSHQLFQSGDQPQCRRNLLLISIGWANKIKLNMYLNHQLLYTEDWINWSTKVHCRLIRSSDSFPIVFPVQNEPKHRHHAVHRTHCEFRSKSRKKGIYRKTKCHRHRRQIRKSMVHPVHRRNDGIHGELRWPQIGGKLLFFSHQRDQKNVHHRAGSANLKRSNEVSTRQRRRYEVSVCSLWAWCPSTERVTFSLSKCLRKIWSEMNVVLIIDDHWSSLSEMQRNKIKLK